MFCLARGNTDGVGEADGVGEELEVGTSAGATVLVSDGTGVRTGVGDGVGSVLAELEEVGVGSAEIDGSGEAEIVGVEVSGSGEFSSARVGATLANIKATTTKKTKRVTNFPFRVERRSRISEAFTCGIPNIGKWYRAKFSAKELWLLTSFKVVFPHGTREENSRT